MRIIRSIDGLAFERFLVDAVRSRSRGGLDEPLAIVVPTNHLAAHLKRRLATELPAVLNVWILTHRALALRALEFALVPPRRGLPGVALGDLLVSRLETRGAAGAEFELLRSHAGARRQFLAALADLRNAGIPGDALQAIDGTSDALRRIYPEFVRALEDLEREGWTDLAGLVQQAVPHVAGFLERKGIRRVLHHGAYELIGVHAELVRACERVAEVTLLLPGESRAPACRYARHLEEWLEPSSVEILAADSPWTQRLRKLYEPEARWEAALEAPRLEMLHAQGAGSELEAIALRLARIHVAESLPWSDMLVVARSLADFTPHLRPAFDRAGVPFVTSARQSQRRQAGAADLLRLLRAMISDFERRATIELLRARSFTLRGIDPGGDLVDRLDRLSRNQRLVSGIDAWKGLPPLARHAETLQAKNSEDARETAPPQPAEQDDELGRSLVEALDQLEDLDSRWKRCRTIDEHASFLQAVVRDLAAGDAVRMQLESLLESFLDDLASCEVVQRIARKGLPEWTAAAFFQRLEEWIDARQVDIDGQRPGGVRVLDAMQARGITARVVVWLGFDHDHFPRRERAALFLTETLRKQLRETTGRFLPPRGEASLEEHLLLAQLLGGVGERLIVSFQRADDDGRKKARSSALREVARLFLGEPDVRGFLQSERFQPFRVSAHPRERAQAYARDARFGLAPLRDALVAAAEGADKGFEGCRAVLQATRSEIGGSEPALRAVEALESFDRVDVPFDGITGEGIEATFRFSARSLQKLTRCPLQFFLSYVLGVDELDREVVPHRIEASVLGSAIHDALASFYGKLEKEGYFERRGEAAFEAALEQLEKLWRKHLKKAAGPAYVRLHGLFELLRDAWSQSLRDFAAGDLRELVSSRASIAGLETQIDATIPLGDGVEPLHAAGRIDRLVRLQEEGGDRLRIDDYKTSRRDLKPDVGPASVLKGENVQLPFYRELVAASERIDVDRVDAQLLALSPYADPGARRHPLKPVSGADDVLRLGFLETVRVAVELARKGYFCAPPDPPGCSHCDFRGGCRHSHEPTIRRYESHPKLDDFRLCGRKSSGKGKSLLKDLRENSESDPKRSGEGES